MELIGRVEPRDGARSRSSRRVSGGSPRGETGEGGDPAGARGVGVVDGAATGAIDRGLLVYVGVEEGDRRDDLEFVAKKVAGLRIFPDAEGKMNLALAQLERREDERIGILAVSQFTLHGDLRKGRRPSYNRAAAPQEANRLYEAIVELWRSEGILVETGVFRRAHGRDVHERRAGDAAARLARLSVAAPADLR